MLSQLVYVSNRKQHCTEEEIEKILASCKKNNPPLNITGILLYSDKKFIQLVEGESKVIMELYDKIKKDDRHTNPMMISLSPVKEKSFPSWHMGSKKLPAGKVDYKTDITTEDKNVFESILNGKEENGERVLNMLKKFF
ncbi:BLUF domain-containing protein [Fulvivirga lutimaris]|uniref:BLUF domain-containing protein n=1 Tax=Fulvivirga lutimaris TaxID=1819566 RepID=UPI0012BD7908|nr:BLUF domain-containing protein [Fulvivirga lutimaris]MTI39419.1 BLUF domain-containing protein [Fulvivirga lutimaris]